jgi:ABC-type bacteriocin/lantibiotic exporter with double-glycine peptidase domain
MNLECHNIHFRHPGTENLLFQDLNLKIDEPGFHALFGPSGVGKSSLARIISGQYPLHQGALKLDGMNEPPLYGYNLERLPGWSNIGRHLDLVTPRHNNDLKEELIQVFGLGPFMRQRFAQLSLGQQNRINLLRYLVQDFQSLIMDETLANVDEKTRGHILLTIKAIFPTRLFIYISHNVIEVATFCRQIWVLRGVQKKPQAMMLSGQDLHPNGTTDRDALHKTMLEIMDAA